MQSKKALIKKKIETQLLKVESPVGFAASIASDHYLLRREVDDLQYAVIPVIHSIIQIFSKILARFVLIRKV